MRRIRKPTTKPTTTSTPNTHGHAATNGSYSVNDNDADQAKEHAAINAATIGNARYDENEYAPPILKLTKNTTHTHAKTKTTR